MGLALATKYTAFQSGAALGISMLAVGLSASMGPTAIRGALTVGLAGLALASPWYIRNIANTGNPVYPFFYSMFHGRNWNQANATAYSAEQQSFGIGQTSSGGKDVTQLPGSVVALAFRPDSQINQGTPTGAVGVPFLLGLIWWPFCGMRGRGRFEKILISTAIITLVTWFFLTQQSRYIISLVALTAPLMGGAIACLPLGRLAAAAVIAQGAYTGFLSYLFVPIAGDREEYLKSTFDFYTESQLLNELGKSENVKVALFDEVRGYYLDVDYFWANPGHHTLLPYDSYKKPDDIVAGLKSLGTTHIYLNFSFLGKQGRNLSEAYADDNSDEPAGIERFRILLLRATREGLLERLHTSQYGDGSIRSLILKIR
jgi:hypothetical protein